MNKESIMNFLAQTKDDQDAAILYEKIAQLLANYSLAKKMEFIRQDMWIVSPFGKLSLEAHSRICRLFLHFIETNKQEATKEELLLSVYKEEMLPRPSDRRLECLERNLVKVISRARTLAKQTFKDGPRNVGWFPYHPAKRTWTLFVMAEEVSMADVG